MKADTLAALRKPFPGDRVGLLPKPYKKDSEKGRCDVCGKWHGLPALHLDYVGHGAVTERLLEVDPEWNWEPLAIDDRGLPAITVRDGTASMWIRLTIDGTTRVGVGTASAGKAELEKELIGDAIRNAAMRFGVALDLWIKGDKAEGEETEVDASRPAPPDHVSEMKTYVLSLTQDEDTAREYVSQAMKALELTNPLSPEDTEAIKAHLADRIKTDPETAPF